MLVALALALAAQASTYVAGGPVLLILDAYGERIKGEVVVDADALADHGVTVRKQGHLQKGRAVPVAHGMRIRGGGVADMEVQAATDAFEALDLNTDGFLDASDASWKAVRLFVDRDGDGKAQPEELQTLDDLGITRISRWGEVYLAPRPARS